MEKMEEASLEKNKLSVAPHFVLMALIELTLLLLDYYPRRVQFIYITLINTKWAQMLINRTINDR